MESKTKTFRKRLLSLVMVFVFGFSIFFSPIAAPKAQAFWGVGDINLESVPTIIDFLVNKVGKQLAQKMIDDIVQSTIKWANTGFDGNPAFITDTGSYFGNIANGVVGDAINDTSFGFLCSPFQAQIRLSLVKQYTQNTSNYQCTLSEIGVNIDNFYQDFNQGGWDAWLKMTQEDQNNPQGAFLKAKLDIDSRLANTLSVSREDRVLNTGFMSKTTCLKKNQPPNMATMARYYDADPEEAQNILNEYPNWNPNKEPTACLEEEVTTPGSVISNQLNKALGSGVDKLISADDIDSLASALLAGLLQRHVFNDKGKGLFNKNSIADTRNEIIDVDGDNIPDGYDYNEDGILDICHHGQKDPNSDPSNDNCLMSGSVSNSPYFIPICKEIPGTIKALEVFNDFITRNDFRKENSVSWSNRMTTMNTAVDDLVSTISRYEVMAWDPVVFTLSQYSKYIGGRISSLLQDDDLKFGGQSDVNELIKIRNNTLKTLQYSRGIKDRIGQCEDPNINAINQVPAPTFEGDEVGNGGTTNTPAPTTQTPTTSNPSLSCAPSTSSTQVGTDMEWIMTSSYPTGTTYRWFGDEIASSDTFFVEPLQVRYSFVGTKTANILATNPSGQAVSISCNGSVSVTDSARNNSAGI
ncbi:MAG TPA: hypothetical protein PLD99_00010 [Parcubacteria group bacterium]|nr:hypothetical protein [Parcubacteria group bacterium]